MEYTARLRVIIKVGIHSFGGNMESKKKFLISAAYYLTIAGAVFLILKIFLKNFKKSVDILSSLVYNNQR